MTRLCGIQPLLRLPYLAAALFVGMVVGGSRVDAATLLVNGDFETVNGTVGTVNGNSLNALTNGGGTTSWDVYGSIPGWVATQDTEQPRGIEVQRNTIVTAHSGTHYVELEAHPGNPSLAEMSQTFTPLITDEHVLDFFYQPRTGTPGDNQIQALLDGIVVETASGPPAPPLGVWTQFLVNLGVLNEGQQYTLAFNALGTTDNTLGGFIDTVSVYATPLPAALPLYGTGLGLMGLFGWWRRRRAAAAI